MGQLWHEKREREKEEGGLKPPPPAGGGKRCKHNFHPTVWGSFGAEKVRKEGGGGSKNDAKLFSPSFSSLSWQQAKHTPKVAG